MPEANATMTGTLVWGHVCLAACAALYLAWWWIFFNPKMPKATGVAYAVGVGCILGAVALGVAAVVLMGLGLSGLAGAGMRGFVPGWAFILGGVVAYFGLVYLTTRFFQRPVTTELLLFVLWAALELAVLNALVGAGAFAPGMAVLLAVVVVVVFAGCLVSYLWYFHLPPLPSFVDGALPLLAVGVFAAVLAVMIAQA